MEVYSVLNDIKNGTLRNFYIFAGEEWKVQQIYIEQIAKVKNLKIKRINSINDIFNQLQNKSLLSSNFCFVCRDDEAITRNEQLWVQIRKGKIFSNHIYILLLTNIDKRTKFCKEFATEICEFKHLEPRVLQKYIQKEIDLSVKNCKKLMEICEYDYGRCLLEIDKIKQYVNTEMPLFGTGKNITEQDCCFEMLVKDGTIYQPPKDAIFDFVDAVLRHNINMSFELLQECYDVGEATMVMLSVLFNNTKNVLQVQACNSNDVSKATGLTGWEIKLAKEKLGYYDIDYLVYMLRQIQKTESGIKQGKIDEDIAMQYLLSVIL